KQQLGELSPTDARLLTADFEADYFGTETEAPRFAAVAVTTPLLDEAAKLCAVHGLRACDAVQLSAALAARQADGTCTALAAFDSSLGRAAATEGFSLIPGNLPDRQS